MIKVCFPLAVLRINRTFFLSEKSLNPPAFKIALLTVRVSPPGISKPPVAHLAGNIDLAGNPRLVHYLNSDDHRRLIIKLLL